MNHFFQLKDCLQKSFIAYKIVLTTILGLLCSGCVWPRYHDDTYPIYLSDTIPGAFNESQDVHDTNTVVTIDSVPSKIYLTSLNDPIQKTPEYVIHERAYVTVSRNLDNPQLSVKKTGFEPYIIPLRKKLTDEKWAQYFLNEGMAEHPLSAAYLPLFPNTWGLVAIKDTRPKDVGSIALSLLITLPFNLAVDVYNFVIGWPLTPVLNPWYDFAYDHTPHILTPTKQMRQACHARPQHLVANSGCENCATTEVLYTSQTECSACKYREYDTHTLMCKLNWLAYCRNVIKPQHSPKKTAKFLQSLRFQQKWTGTDHILVPINSNTYVSIASLIHDCGIDIYETDSEGRSLPFYMSKGYWHQLNPQWDPIIKNGTLPTMKDKYGMTPSQYQDTRKK